MLAYPETFGALRKRSTAQGRAGAAMLELAIVLPIFLMLVLGIIEMGRVMMLNQMATNACREGCRRAVVPGTTDEQVLSAVNGYLDVSGIATESRTVRIMDANGSESSLANIGSHETVTVEVTFPYSGNTWGFTSIMGSNSLVAQATMRRE